VWLPATEDDATSVSAQRRSYRDALRRALLHPNITVMAREDFIPTGTEPCDKPNNGIRF
jgi:hypothetical protein